MDSYSDEPVQVSHSPSCTHGQDAKRNGVDQTNVEKVVFATCHGSSDTCLS